MKREAEKMFGPSPESLLTKRKKAAEKPATKPAPKRRKTDARSQSETFVEDDESTGDLFVTASKDDHTNPPDSSERKGNPRTRSTEHRAHMSKGAEEAAKESITDRAPEEVASEPHCSRASGGNTNRDSGTAQPMTANSHETRSELSEDEDGITIAADVEPDEPLSTRLRLRPPRKPRSEVPDLALDGKIIVAVDFGTTFSGLCWAHTRCPDDQNIIAQWPDDESNEAVSSAKVPTELQYTEDGFNWGFQIPHDAQRHQWFKLGLDPKRPRPMSGLASGLPDEKAAPPEHDVPLETLVKDYLSALRQHLESVLAKTLPKSVLMTTPMEYVITVPAIWSGKASGETRSCAERAGMGLGKHLQLVSEPEAAATWALPRIVPFTPQIGDTFVLCDAGGGTVDLISYQIKALKPTLRIVEAARGDGGLCGSTFLNRSFTAFLREKLGGHPAWQDEMLEEAEKRFDTIVKRRFNGSKTAEHQIPAFPDDEELGVYKAMFKMKGEDLLAIFEPVIQEVIVLVTRQLHAAKAANAAPRAIVLVGGFGENNYLYQRICQAVADQGVEVLRPAGGFVNFATTYLLPALTCIRWTAVVHGALMKGLSEASKNTSVATVSGRKARNYFGTASAKTYDKTKHPVGARFWSKAKKRHEVNTYDWFIIKNATVKEKKPINLPYHFEVLLSAVESGALAPITTTIVKYVDPEDTGPPIFVGDGDDDDVETVASLQIPLDQLSMKRLQRRKRKDGSEWYIVDFSLRVICCSSETFYELRHNGKDYGRVSAEYV
ncbi:MAG: hypothetical protein Q9193_002370 [Seirophora villosa]